MSIEKILLDHGSGGKASQSLIAELFLPHFQNPILASLDDSAVFDIKEDRIAFSTDTYVVDPIFFPGGNIGDLAINGTVNDLAMCGATPLYLSAGLIIEEGFSALELKRILKAMGEAARKADVLIVTGDTKVVPRGAADKIFVNTSGVGCIPQGVNISGHNACPNDKVIISGTIAEHGITILTQREGMTFESRIKSDTAPLNHMVCEMIAQNDHIHALRDPTRGGVGTVLNEIATQSNVGIRIYEEALPIRKEVSAICELLGFDPLYIANEGKLIAFVGPDVAEKVLETMKANEYGKDASIIGEVVDDSPGRVFMKTRIGGTRIVGMLTGEQLPRIC
ncbi:MAG: hydrogenase expression/formation protein HypE [Desulfobacterales bacterium C00003060]|nr:MAG: hydrogenase expression/formation protein HypE [Desulfobacterales bacterium S3730MH5]OEU78116.1 MAG: hydrogenase expression/formation protein HypE [Desulfobacterales bacterium C00003060]